MLLITIHPSIKSCYEREKPHLNWKDLGFMSPFVINLGMLWRRYNSCGRNIILIFVLVLVFLWVIISDEKLN